MKCEECKTFKKASNCQQCYLKEKQKLKDIFENIQSLLKIHHLTTLDKIKEYMIKTLENY